MWRKTRTAALSSQGGSQARSGVLGDGAASKGGSEQGRLLIAAGKGDDSLAVPASDLDQVLLALAAAGHQVVVADLVRGEVPDSKSSRWQHRLWLCVAGQGLMSKCTEEVVDGKVRQAGS